MRNIDAIRANFTQSRRFGWLVWFHPTIIIDVRLHLSDDRRSVMKFVVIWMSNSGTRSVPCGTVEDAIVAIQIASTDALKRS